MPEMNGIEVARVVLSEATGASGRLHHRLYWIDEIGGGQNRKG